MFVASNPLQTAAELINTETVTRWVGGGTLSWQALATIHNSLQFVAAGGADFFSQNAEVVAPPDLYWQANATPDDDYQVFVHIFDSQGTMIAQQDSAPVGGTYPTSQWRVGVIIADPHILTLTDSLPAGKYTVAVGLYRLVDYRRLPISPADTKVQNDVVFLSSFDH